ncbi:dicarboxylate/amino acid:cation symporter [Geobacter sp. AOG2]|uniref:dicarboxylate/amino acid:cation symporter n=1 Tax=Geobacter sp. AOG2 TaxID=1566347 RepID=UPI001CC53995|nr:dicarboxylate/amino acid:cation symporter [Geobacter sp. AOG2]GFE62624.1 aerobic C4-dicarboxylate transport protein [Geobacter sp. AOG2]
MKGKRIYGHLYFQVLTAIAAGVALGYYYPEAGVAMKPFGDGFIKLIKMIITPVIFCTVVNGIAGMEDMKKVGRVGVKALLYFELVTTAALLIGLVIVSVIQPGSGFNADVSKIDTTALTAFTAQAKSTTTADFLMNIIPTSVVDAFAKGNILQVLLFSLLFGFALSALGERGKVVCRLVEQIAHVLFEIVGIIMRLAPLGAFGAMAFTIGKFGVGSLSRLGMLMGSFYLTCIIFIFLVLGTIARLTGFNIFKFIRYVSEEILIVLGTSSSESALPRMMSKLENLGCRKSVVGLVIPTGYSFNLDGTSIYLTMAALFVAQATNTHLTLIQTLTVLAILLLTSKGAAGVTGSGFVTLAATFAAIPTIPVAGLALILGIDRFMSEARAITNLIGNGVATVVVSKWEDELDEERLHRVLNREVCPEVGEEQEDEVSFLEQVPVKE